MGQGCFRTVGPPAAQQPIVAVAKTFDLAFELHAPTVFPLGDSPLCACKYPYHYQGST